MEHPPPEGPREIGKFRILRQLGQGAMGRVYLAEDPLIDRRVAVKVMTVADDPESRERFRNEARTVGQLSHPNIVQLYELGFHQDQPFLAMEYLEGESLDRWLGRRQPLEERIRVLVDLCRAVDHAHGRGVLHRDVKPANVQVLPDGTCKLMDFGIARSSSVRLTATGMVLGTPEFIAPEVLQDAGYSPASDIYAVALVIYQAFSGFNPFHAATLEACITRVLTHAPRPLAELEPGIDAGLSRVLEACLSKDPARRPSDLKPVQAALEGVLASERTVPLASAARREPPSRDPEATTSTVVRPAPAAGTWRRRAATAVTVAAVAGGLLIWRYGGESESRPAERLAEAPPAAVAAEPHPEPADGAIGEDAGTVADEDTGKEEDTRKEEGDPAPRPARPTPGSAPRPVASRSPESPLTAPAVELPAESEPPPPSPPPPEPSQAAAADLSETQPERTQPPTTEPAVALRRPADDPPPIPEAAPAAEETRAAEVTAAPRHPRPEIHRLSPRLVRRGAAATLRLEGAAFGPRARAEARRGNRPVPGIRIRKLELSDPGTLELSLFVDQTVPLGLYSVVVIDGEGNESEPANLEVGL